MYNCIMILALKLYEEDKVTGKFSYKDIYIEDGKRVLEVNILPEKYCDFDCIFCPIGRSRNKVDTQRSFDKIISPDKIIIARMEDKRFKKKLGITDERFEEISNALLNI